MRGVRLPVHSVKRDGSGDEGLTELKQYFEGNEKWSARNAMIGFFSGGSVKVLKPKGPQKYIQYSQTADNKFTFPALEAIALVLSKRLVVFGRDGETVVPLSAHFLFNRALKLGFPVRSIFHYAMFSRFAVCARRGTGDEHKQVKTDQSAPTGFAARLVQARAASPKCVPKFATSMFPATHYVKIPSHHNLDDAATLSIPGFPGVEPDSPVFTAISFKCIVRATQGPGVNRAMLPFLM